MDIMFNDINVANDDNDVLDIGYRTDAMTNIFHIINNKP